MNLTLEQKAKRGEILKTLVRNKREKCPWLTLKEAVDIVAQELDSDTIKLRFINALAASSI